MNNEDEFLDYEEQFHTQDKKESRKERKSAIKRDRSKYKVSNQNKIESQEQELQKEEFLGRVLQVLPENTLLVDSDKGQIHCHFKGSMRYQKTKMRNIIAVGDFVHVKMVDNESGLISHVRKRRSILTRTESKQTKKNQVLAANVDQVLITLSILQPKLKPHLIDRYIMACKEGNITPVIIFNKVDLLSNQVEGITKQDMLDATLLTKELTSIYSKLGIQTLTISATNGDNLDELKAIMKGKTSVFSGQSGVGKTSLINTLTGRDYKTAKVMAQNQKGAHTTTVAILFPIDSNSYCIDTPGIKSFGMGELEPKNVRHYFEEIAELSKNCRFSGCSHTHEPDCAVKTALENGEISKLRYLSYCNLMGIEPIDSNEEEIEEVL
ncbi:MAG: ribosome small subunit-dependent GTPase A [Rhabdochlamydiaceae bacterium]|nr:ribosome small subunit-dependent GTPase A [Candidatus Amphrikana amoebophyrae]